MQNERAQTEELFNIRYIATEPQLRETAAVLHQKPELALDLEFDQNRHTYGFNLCLIQISDGQTCYIIDPFEIADLQPLWLVLEDPKIAKIIHHANNDIMLLSKLGCHIRNVIDTDIAAKILNREKSSLASVLAEDFQISLDKSQQGSNWNLRPLTEQQLRYAALDVNYLHAVKDKLVSEIQRLGRMHWLLEEGRLLEQITYSEPEEPHLHMKLSKKLNYFELFILKDLYAFREALAKKVNKPAGFVIPNEALAELARHPETDVEEFLGRTKGIHRRVKQESNVSKLQKLLTAAEKRATEHQISREFPNNYWRRPFKTAETQQREETIQRVQEELIKRVGPYASRLIITTSVINEYALHGKLAVHKQYALAIILEIASELGVDLHLKV